MKAILLSAGYGKRLLPLTKYIPKCLVKVHNLPILEIWLRVLYNSKVDGVLINTHYKYNEVEEFLHKFDYLNFTTTKYEKTLLGTAGTLINNLDFFGKEDGFLIHADNFCRLNLQNIIDSHLKRPKKCLLTMVTFNCANPLECGIVELDDENVVNNYYEKSKLNKGNLANGAIYIFSPEFIEILKNDFNDATDFVMDILPHFLNKIYTYHSNDIFYDIGNLETLKYVNDLKLEIKSFF